MTTQHTPGPWWVYDESDRYPGIEAASCSIVVLGDEKRNFHGVQGVTDEESLANARLIASAPDMLEALRQVAASWYRDEVPHGIRELAIKTIAKAEGREA